MAKKKIILFIVEGPSDETSLSTVLSRIFSSSSVKFQVIHGDILTRGFTSPEKIVTAVWALSIERVIFAGLSTSPTRMVFLFRIVQLLRIMP